MDKRNSKKTEPTDRKLEKKDRGDLKKAKKQIKEFPDSDTNEAKLHPGGDLKKAEKQLKKAVNFDVNDAKIHPDRGDSDRKIVKVEKPKLNVFVKKQDDSKSKNIDNSKENVNKPDVETAIKIVLDERRKMREKNALKQKDLSGITLSTNKREESKLVKHFKTTAADVNDRISSKTTEASKEKSDESNESKQSITTVNITKSDKKDSVHRKPIIRTISSKNDTTKIYKAVTFVDQKKKSTMLQIKIPNEIPKNPKTLPEANTNSKKVKPEPNNGDSVKEKTVRKKMDRIKKDKRPRHITSPDLSFKTRSPPTEVAKWAPSSINRHTKPYYEAWVSTTLAAISKNSKRDKLFLEKQNILQSFQRALAERPATPELVYENLNDERYTGRIKVKQR